jgi:hypothetical protein
MPEGTEPQVDPADRPTRDMGPTFDRLARDEYWQVPEGAVKAPKTRERDVTLPLTTRVRDGIITLNVLKEIRNIATHFDATGKRPEPLAEGQSTGNVDPRDAVFKVTRDRRLFYPDAQNMTVDDVEPDTTRQVDPLLFDLTADMMADKALYTGWPVVTSVLKGEGAYDIVRSVEYLRATASGEKLTGFSSDRFVGDLPDTDYSDILYGPHLQVGERRTADAYGVTIDEVIAAIEVIRVPGTDDRRRSVLREIGRAIFNRPPAPEERQDDDA